MIEQEIYLEKYDWNVIVCHVVNQEDVDEAMDLLSSIDCKGQPLLDAYDHISTNTPNKGLTYTNVSKNTSVVLICKSTSEGEYINSLTHETSFFLFNCSTFLTKLQFFAQNELI